MKRNLLSFLIVQLLLVISYTNLIFPIVNKNYLPNDTNIDLKPNSENLIPSSIDPLSGWPINIGPPITGYLACPSCADIDGDGYLDVVIGSFDDRVFAVDRFGNNLTGWPWISPGPSLDFGKSSPAIGDIDNDNLPEIVIGSNTGASLYVFEHNGLVKSGWPQSTGNFWSSPALGDIDGDNVPEIIVGSSTDWNVYAFNYDGTSVAGWPVNFGTNVVTTPALGDIDGDDLLEIVVVSDDGLIYVLENTGSSKAGWGFDMGTATAYSAPAIGDLTGDGQLEIVATNFDGHIYAFYNNGTVMPGWPIDVGDDIYSSPALGDLDGDTYPEIVIGSASQNIYALNYDGTNVPGWPVPAGGAIYGVPTIFGSPVIGDINGDGLLDVLIGETYPTSRLNAFHHNGTVMTDWPYSIEGGIYSTPSLCDLDKDGKVEVIFTSNEGKAHALKCSGTYNSLYMPWPMYHHDLQHTGLYSIHLRDLYNLGEEFSGFGPTVVTAGLSNFTIYCDIYNEGNVASGDFNVSFYASLDSIITSGDYFIGIDTISSISEKEKAESNWFGTFPNNIPEGAYYVGWVIDSDNNVNETDETNNIAYKRSCQLYVFKKLSENIFDFLFSSKVLMTIGITSVVSIITTLIVSHLIRKRKR